MKAACLLALCGAVLFAAISALRPLMPVDETRYLSVAWEMLQQGNWVLPTLNYAPYSHKPPLLFWLLRGAWEVFGVHVWAARLMIFVLAGGVFYLCARLARALFPHDARAGMYAALLLAAMPGFLFYASVIMFDVLLAACVLAGMLALWQAAQAPRLLHFALWGAVLGLGVLAKGPVALVYMLPCAVLAPWWSAQNWARWYGGVLLGIAVAAFIGLGWAVQAAIEGGPAYAQKIFVTQSAGRMVNAFDHARPAWFYLPVLAGFLLPLLAWAPLWRRANMQAQDARAFTFLACWAVPAIAFFSLSSSKQIHYMLPLLPGFAVLAGVLAARAKDAAPAALTVPLAVLAAPSLGVLAFGISGRAFMGHVPDATAMMLAAGHIVLSVALFAASHKEGAGALCAAAFLLVIAVHAQAGRHLLPRYDLAPLAAEMAHYEQRPMAATPKYDGEYGFAARATDAIPSVGREHIDEWFAANPGGVIIGRYKPADIPPGYAVLFEMPFRTEEALVILEAK